MGVSANLVSWWEFSNPDPAQSPPGPWANEVTGGPAMAHDIQTVLPAIFDPFQTRLETFPDPNTRIAASGPELELDTFSFSMIIDPTDIGNFTALLTKESAAPDTFDNFQRVGWQVSHTEFGNLEFVVRGTDPGTSDFFGNTTVLSADSGFADGQSFDDDTRFHVAGGYDSTTGAARFFVTELVDGGVGAINAGSNTAFTPGAQQDASPLALGEARSGVDFVSIGAGFDIDDLQIYDRLLGDTEFLFLAQNPNQPLPAGPTSPVDFAEPFGVIDFFDYDEFLTQFLAATTTPAP